MLVRRKALPKDVSFFPPVHIWRTFCGIFPIQVVVEGKPYRTTPLLYVPRPYFPATMFPKKIIPVAQGPVRNVVGTTSGAQWRNTALALGMGIACAARRRVQRVQRNATVQQWNARV